MGMFGVTRNERDEALQKELEAIREQNRVLQAQLAAIEGRLNATATASTSYSATWPTATGYTATMYDRWRDDNAWGPQANEPEPAPEPQPDPRPVIVCLYNGGSTDPDGVPLPSHVTWRGLGGWPSYVARIVRGDYDLSVSVPYQHPFLGGESGRMTAFRVAQLLEAWIEMHPAIRARVLAQLAPDMNILTEEGVEVVPGCLLEELDVIPQVIKDWQDKAPFVAVKPVSDG